MVNMKHWGYITPRKRERKPDAIDGAIDDFLKEVKRFQLAEMMIYSGVTEWSCRDRLLKLQKEGIISKIRDGNTVFYVLNEETNDD